MSTHLPFLACWEFPKPFYFLSLNIPFEKRHLLHFAPHYIKMKIRKMIRKMILTYHAICDILMKE